MPYSRCQGHGRGSSRAPGFLGMTVHQMNDWQSPLTMSQVLFVILGKYEGYYYNTHFKVEKAGMLATPPLPFYLQHTAGQAVIFLSRLDW